MFLQVFDLGSASKNGKIYLESIEFLKGQIKMGIGHYVCYSDRPFSKQAQPYESSLEHFTLYQELMTLVTLFTTLHFIEF